MVRLGNHRMSIGCSADKEAIYKDGIRATFIEIQSSNLDERAVLELAPFRGAVQRWNKQWLNPSLPKTKFWGLIYRQGIENFRHGLLKNKRRWGCLQQKRLEF